MFDKRKMFGAFCMAIALFFFWPVVIGSWDQISAMRSAVSERKEILKKRQDILARVNKMYKEYQDKMAEQGGQKLSALVPVKKDSAELISALQGIADGSGATISEAHISELKEKEVSGQYKTITLNLEMKGTYSSVRSFLKNLEQYVRLLNVNSLQMTQDPQNAGRLRFTVKADTYFLK